MLDKQRKIIELQNNWKFSKTDITNAEQADFDDSNWAKVRVPHDWAITGPIDKENNAQTGGLPVTGTAWYRRLLPIQNYENKRVFIEFDGVMSNSAVFLNGHRVGNRPYGYISFSYDLTPYLENQNNVLAVRVSPEKSASRWYPGAGIYRNVRLVIANSVHVSYQGTYITTPYISEKAADIKINTEIVNHQEQDTEVELTTIILNPENKEAIRASTLGLVDKNSIFEQNLSIKEPVLWNLDKPRLYTAFSLVKVDGKIMDRYETTFGIRTIKFDSKKGFFLNENNLKLKGICRHHDLGPLGAALHKKALLRQLHMLKDMGCNAIRTSHNPPAPDLLNLCDNMGFLVLDEAFDEWKIKKTENGYHKFFDEWAEKDLRDMIRRDRNHPSVIMWSIGNEVGEQFQEKGAEVARFLTDICHEEDPTRPVTAGFNSPEEVVENGLTDAVDILGWNYRRDLYKRYHRTHPEWIMYGSETSSCISSRGEYFLPAKKERFVKIRSSQHSTSYDLGAAKWGEPPDYEFRAQEECPHILGEFVWTAFDYLGEPTPYNWPSRSSYFGIIDLCGFPKDRYFLYRSHWNEKKETLHLLPHWNWEGREGKIVPVYCYTSYNSAELFLNGKSQGIRKKEEDDTLRRYRICWDEVRYEPGALEVVALDGEGKPVLSREVKTAGQPAKVELQPDCTRIKADGDDLCYLEVRITDKEGNLCPLAQNRVDFKITGPADLIGVGNGDPTSNEPFNADYRHAFHGLCLAVIRAKNEISGQISVIATMDDLEETQVIIESISPFAVSS